MTKVWTKLDHNSVLDGDGFFISYSACPGSVSSFFEGDGGSDETALVRKEGGRRNFRILNGDFRENYEEVIDQGWEACLAVYEAHEAKHNSSRTT